MGPGRRVEAVPPELRGGVSVTSPPPGSPEGGFGWSALRQSSERGGLSAFRLRRGHARLQLPFGLFPGVQMRADCRTG